jgi:hypothetical protein
VQPALVDVLKQRVGLAVGLRGDAGAVPSDHDGVAALLLEDRVAQDRLELGLVAPGVELGIGDRPVEVGLLAAIGVHLAGRSVGWRRLLAAVLVRPEIGRVTPMPTFCPS